MKCKLGDYDTYWHGLRGYSGVSLHIRKGAFDAAPAFSHPDFDMESRIVQAEIGQPRARLGLRAQRRQGLRSEDRLPGEARRLGEAAAREGRELVLCGDMNVTRSDIDVHPKEAKPGIIGQREEERELFDKLLGDHLVDVGRALDPDNANLFTWWAPWRNMRQRNIGWRIDYILASPSLAARAEGCVVLADFGTSDHAPLVMTAA